MKFINLLTMSAGNLKRRYLRIFLTVLGVVIGRCSIVIMISLGFGSNKGKEPKRLTDETVKEFLALNM